MENCLRRFLRLALTKCKKDCKIPKIILVQGFCPLKTEALSLDLHDARQKLNLLKRRTDYVKCSFSYCRASLWNNLPEESLDIFERSINKWFSVSDSHMANM